MNIIVCVDDNNGLMFNKRRQSKDSVVREYILMDAKASKLWLNNYSAMQFDECHKHLLCVDEQFLDKVTEEDFAFVENLPLKDYFHKIKQIIIYRWNRKYPADLYFDIDVNTNSWKLIVTEEFSGSSHDKISKEVYQKID